jgi:hypothetical protein
MVGHLLQHIMSHDKRIHHREQPGMTAASRGGLPLLPWALAASCAKK